MSAIKEPGPCPFCAWDHPGDPPHAQGCIIGPYVAFARAEGVADERARVVADLRRKADIVSIMRSMEATTTARALRERADRYERGEHDKEGT